MAKNYYSSYNQQELAEIYTTTLANYGKVEGALLEEINQRGGIALLEKQIQSGKALVAEQQRIINEVRKLTNSVIEYSLVRKLIESDILDESELDLLVEKAYAGCQQDIKNRTVGARTIVGCLTGAFLGTIAGSAIWLLQIFFLEKVYYFNFVVIYFVAYFIIRVLTKQNAGNIMVLLAGLLASMLSALVPYFLLK